MPRSLSRAGWVLAVSVLLGACATTPGRATRFGYSVDSPSAACRHSPSACLALHGKEVASATAVLKAVLDVATRTSIDQELADCANRARSDVLPRHEGDFETLFPNVIECNQLAKNPRRKGMTWAMQLGVEMHEEAMNCAEERLGKLRPGGYNLEQRNCSPDPAVTRGTAACTSKPQAWRCTWRRNCSSSSRRWRGS